MIIPIVSESVLVSDTEAENMPEFPVVITNYPQSDGMEIMNQEGKSVYFSYRMAKEVAKVILDYSKPKKKSK